MRLSFELTGNERPATAGARVVSAGDAAAFDLSALLLPTLALPQPAAPSALALGVAADLASTDDGGDVAAAAADGGKSIVATKTLPLMFLRPEFDDVPAAVGPSDVKTHARHQNVEPACDKPAAAMLSETLQPQASPLPMIVPAMAAESAAPISTPLSLPPIVTAPLSLPPTATAPLSSPATSTAPLPLPPITAAPSPLPPVSVELVMSALDAPEEPPVPAVELLKAQLLTAAVKTPAVETPPDVSTPMLMAEVVRDLPKPASAGLQVSAERGVKSLKPAERESERRVLPKGEPAAAVALSETAAVVRPAAAAHQTFADHDAQRAVRILTNAPARGAGSPSLMTESAAASIESYASLERSTLPQLSSRVIESMRIQLNAGGGQVEIRLNPESLGSVKVSIAVDHGSVKATVTAGTPAALEALRADAVRLRHALEEHGLRLDEFELREDPSFGRPPGDREPHDTPDQEPQRREARVPQASGASEFSQVFDVVA